MFSEFSPIVFLKLKKNMSKLPKVDKDYSSFFIETHKNQGHFVIPELSQLSNGVHTSRFRFDWSVPQKPAQNETNLPLCGGGIRTLGAPIWTLR